ncbi:MAG: hypothetical protein H7235_06315 [Bdellovibrionaceae bacterium]|nr:hypothetical protein [Pseudobdellovibrionaceae bacterium]
MLKKLGKKPTRNLSKSFVFLAFGILGLNFAHAKFEFSLQELWALPVGSNIRGITYKDWGRKVAVNNTVDRCYDSTCVYNAFSNLISQTKEILKITEAGNSAVFESTLLKLKEKTKEKSKTVSEKDLEASLRPLFETIFSMPWYTYHDQAYSQLDEILKACQFTVESGFDQLKNSSKPLDPMKRNVLVKKCMWDTGGVKSIFSSKAEKKCSALLDDTLKAIDWDTVPGTFATKYSDFLIKNPRFDQMIINFQEKLQPYRDKIKSINDLKDRSKIPAEVRDLDIGKLALEVAGNPTDAIHLLQLTVSDPGLSVIHPMVKDQLIKTDPARWLKLSKGGFSNGLDPKTNWGLMKATENYFGMSFKQNWGNRNYKIGAGLTLALDLESKGYSDSEIRWVSRTMGEAYKVQTHLLSAKNIEGDRPYFILDAAAHEVGSDLALSLSRGIPLEKYLNERYPTLRKESQELVTTDWERFKKAHSMMQSGKSMNELLSTK